MTKTVSNMPWVDTYQPHTWRVHEVLMSDPDQPPTEQANELQTCTTESLMAKSLWDNKSITNVFYLDLEQMAADYSGIHGSAPLARLTTDWRGHSAGALVYHIYVGDFVTRRTFLIEDI